MKNEETLILTDTVRARVITLAPRQGTGFHHHTEITDHMFCVSGEIVVRLKSPLEEIVLSPGNRCTVHPGRVHQVMNNLETACSEYLLLQGAGRYDFITEDV